MVRFVKDGSSQTNRSTATSLGVPSGNLDAPSLRTTHSLTEDPGSVYEPSVSAHDMGRVTSHKGPTTTVADDDDDDEFDDASSHEVKPHNKDAFNITAQSAKLQLDLLTSVSAALRSEKDRTPALPISDPIMLQALDSYESAIGNLKSLVSDLLRISRDRDAYWQYRLDREANVRRMWEDSMAKVAKEQEDLEAKLGESELKRRKTKTALREALEDYDLAGSGPGPEFKDDDDSFVEANEISEQPVEPKSKLTITSQKMRRKATFADIAAEMSGSDSEDDEEFFDAVGAGEVEVVQMPEAKLDSKEAALAPSTEDLFEKKHAEIATAWAGYEDGPRKKLAMDADDRPKISLWVRLLSRMVVRNANHKTGHSKIHDW